MVMRAAHLEAQIDDLLFHLSPLEQYTEKEQKFPISKKIAKAEKILNSYRNEFSEKIIGELNLCKTHFDWRNELVHGRIYSEYHPKNLVSGRHNVPDRRATSEELYLLANNLEKLTHRLQWPVSLPNFVSQALLKEA